MKKQFKSELVLWLNIWPMFKPIITQIAHAMSFKQEVLARIYDTYSLRPSTYTAELASTAISQFN